MAVKMFGPPVFYFTEENFGYMKQTPVILNYINYSKFIFTMVFIVIVYIKYFKTDRDEL